MTTTLDEALDELLAERYDLQEWLSRRTGYTVKVYDRRRRAPAVLRVAETRLPGLDNLRRISSGRFEGLTLYTELGQHDSQTAFAVRPFRVTTLESELRLVDSGDVGDRLSYPVIRGVLRGVKSLHEHDLVHGDLRPNNVLKTSNSWTLADFGLTGGFSADLDEDARSFSAPEVLARENPPSRASDIFSFGRLADHVIQSAAGEYHIPGVDLSSEQLRWLLAYCQREEPAERPTAEALWELLFDAPRLRRRARKALRLAATDAKPPGTVPDKAMRDLEAAPELAVALVQPHRALRYLHVLNRPLANSPEIPYSDRVMKEKRFPSGLDMVWQDRLEQDHSGQLRAEAKRHRGQISGERAQVLAARFAHTIAIANAVRDEVLMSTPMLYTSEVAALMTAVGELSVTAGDVLLLMRSGRMLALQDHGRTLYPEFQFDSSWSPRPIIGEVNATLGATGREWSTVSWWCSAHGGLENQSPRDWLLSEQDEAAILSAAQLTVR